MDPHKIIASLMDTGLTMAEIAKLTGLTQASVSRIKNKHQQPKWDAYQRLLRAYREIVKDTEAA